MILSLQGLHEDLCRTVWTHPCNETERTPESGPQRRRERFGYCRACLERASPHGLVSSGGGGYGAVPVPQTAVGVVAHSQRAEPHEQRTWAATSRVLLTHQEIRMTFVLSLHHTHFHSTYACVRMRDCIISSPIKVPLNCVGVRWGMTPKLHQS